MDYKSCFSNYPFVLHEQFFIPFIVSSDWLKQTVCCVIDVDVLFEIKIPRIFMMKICVYSSEGQLAKGIITNFDGKGRDES